MTGAAILPGLSGTKQKVINRNRPNRERHISSEEVFSVRSTPCFECLWNFNFFEGPMRRFLTAGILVVLIAASALAGYEIGVHQPVWGSSAGQVAKPETKSEPSAADDVTFSIIFDRTVRQAAEKIDGLAAR